MTTESYARTVKRLERRLRESDAIAEFSPTTPPGRRNETEHPERAYRRGYQQGAYTVLDGLEKAEVLDPSTREQLREFVHWTLCKWRYRKRPLKREIIRDREPEFRLKQSQRRGAA